MTTASVKTQAQKAATKRIHTVTIRRMFDDSPDTSWLGEYSNSPTSEYSIDRKHKKDCDYFNTDHMEDCDCGGKLFDMRRGEVRYFNPSSNYVDKRGHALPENTPDEVREYVRQDYERMEALNRGDWCFVGVRAEAEYSITINADRIGRRDTIQTVTSAGVWGIESDAGDYFKEVEQEELAGLRSQLEAIGFSKRAVSAAFRNIERKGE